MFGQKVRYVGLPRPAAMRERRGERLAPAALTAVGLHRRQDAQGAYPSTPGTPGGNVHSDSRKAPGSASYDGFSTESPALQKYFRERAVVGCVAAAASRQQSS